MKAAERRELIAAAAPGAALAVLLLAGGLGFAATLEPAERAALAAMLETRGALLLLGWLVLALAFGTLARTAYRHWVTAPAQLVEHAGVLLGTDAERTIEAAGSAANRALAQTVNELVRQRAALRADIAFLAPQGEAPPLTRPGLDYVARLQALPPPHLAAHAYVRYLGDLAGGPVLARIVGRAYGLQQQGLAFYRFDGDAPTLADCVLVPQIFNAQRFDCRVDHVPTVMRVFDACMKLDAFERTRPEHCPDFE